ncbi:MAG: hypothetical protein LBQ37_04665 [Elusimicrobiota bacterium]|jgi:hypothetical protein|nr:hypothetical protein [Elusimicrobiota bacterium]
MKKILLVLFLLVFTVPGVFAAKMVEANSVEEKFYLRPEHASFVHRAIVKACEDRKWRIVQDDGKEITAVLDGRNYSLTIAITYGNTGYTIAYKDSKGLKYNPEKNTIHSSYERWLRNLNKDINANINLLKG